MITGNDRSVARIARSVSMPSISGISTSSVTMSGFSVSILFRAIAPFAAMPTTSRSGSSSMTVVSSLRTTTASSTTSTRMGLMTDRGA
jgi:hypothetical protein